MRTFRFLIACSFLCFFAGSLSDTFAYAAEETSDPDEKILKDAKMATDNASLLAYLRNKCGDEADLLRMSGLVRQLGSEKIDERKAAHNKLVALGFVAVPFLQHAAREGDPETSRQAKSCLTEIGKEKNWWVPAALIRLLVRRNPAETTEALLRYLPSAPEGDTEEEIWFGLSALAYQGKVSLPALRKGLNDPLVARRAVAACILGRMGNDRDRQAVRDLLKDDDPTVRLRAAQGLLAGRDITGVPVLIELLEETSAGITWQAEELLRWIAGESSPKEIVGSGKSNERKKCKDGWEKLWKSQLKQIDIFKLNEESRRPCLVLASGRDRETPGQLLKRVWLCGSDGIARWQKGNISDLSCVGMVGPDRVMIVEGLENLRFVEEDFQGHTIWEHKYDNRCFPLFCRRLPNGETLVGGLSSLHMIDAADHTVRELDEVRLESCQSLLPNGRILCNNRHDESILFEFDPYSKRISNPVRAQAKRTERWEHINLQALWNGNYLLVVPNEGKVMELTREGKPLWEYSKASATHALPLRGGSILVAVHEGVNGRLILLDSRGKAYSEIIPHDSTSRELIACFSMLRVGFEQATPERDLDSIATHIRGLKSKDVIIRQRAANELASLGGRASEAIPSLVEALADPDLEVRKHATYALNNCGVQALPHFVKALEHINPAVREEGAHGLELLGRRTITRSDKAVAPLIVALADNQPRVRARAAQALGQYPDHADASVPKLVGALEDREQVDEFGTVQIDVLLALSNLGSKAKAAVPSVLDLLSHSDPVVRRLAAISLGHIAPEDEAVQKSLLRLLKTETNNNVQAGAAWAVARAGARAKAAVPTILKLLKNTQTDRNNPGSRRALVAALGEIGPDGLEVVPTLLGVLTEPDADDSVRLAVIDTLIRLTPSSREAISVLKQMARDPSSRVRIAATKALEKLQPKD
jgi:HEAT repeat protein